MQEKRTKPGEKAKHDLNEKTTYRFGNRSFIVEPVFKEETQNTLGCVLLRLMKSESAGAEPPASTKRKTCFVLERGERGGAAAAPAGRKLPQEARAARSWGGRKSILAEC